MLKGACMAQNIRTKGNPTLENGQQRIYLRFLTVFLLVGALAAVAFIMGSLITMYSAFGDFEEFRRMDIGTLFAKLIPGLIMFLIAFAALIAFIVIWFRKTVSDPLVDIDAGMQEIKRGNYSARITIDSRDEFYNIAQTFNATMDRIQALIQTEEERARMQHNIMEFLGILSAASEGDLTKKAVVTPDVFGSLADAFNLMSSGLAELITSVQVSAAEANAKSSALVRITEQLASGAGKQEKEVQTASAFVQDSSQSALIIARKTNSARQIAESATAAAEKGGKMVSSSMSGIQVIRNTVQAINKRMKSLAEKLMEIGTISQLITEIANRTNLLALNASIEAARAGEQGKGFVVIAEEIRNLSERSAKSTKQIAEVISAIQGEAAGVTKHLEEETNLVEMETKMAADTGAIFSEIDAVIKQIEALTSEIDASTEEQRELTGKVETSMHEVQRVSRDVLSVVNDLSSIASSLAATSQSLAKSTSRFRF